MRSDSSGWSCASSTGFSVDALGMKLLIDPFLQADLLHALDIAGPGAEGQPIQRVQDLIVLAELLLEQLA